MTQVGGIGSAEAFGRPAVVTSVPDGATLEERVAYLLRRDEKTQKRLQKLAARDKELADSLPEREAELRAWVEEYVEREIATAHALYRPLRYVGVAALVVGVGCLTAATFV